MAFIVGTSGNNTLRGTAFEDFIDGRAGNDRLFGLGGDDTLLGGPGKNLIDGGAGRDLVGYRDDEDLGAVGPNGPLQVDLAAGTYVTGGVTSSLVGVEDAAGGSANDVLAGDRNANLFSGSEGDDALRGLGGGDDLFGDDGRDSLDGGGGADTLRGGDGVDALGGGEGEDVLRLDTGNDTAAGGSGIDEFDLSVTSSSPEGLLLATVTDFSTRGGDVIDGRDGFAVRFDGTDRTQPLEFVGTGAFADDEAPEVRYEYRAGDTYVVFEGWDGDGWDGSTTAELRLSGRLNLTADDFLLGETTTLGNDTVRGTRFTDVLRGSDGDDILVSLEGNDELVGGEGNDRLRGGAGDDLLSGDEGDDTYFGGDGDDLLLHGDGGSETFVFEGRFGNDEIFDSGPYTGEDTVVFADLAEEDVTQTRNGDSLTVTADGTGDSVDIQNFFGFGDYSLVFGG